MRAGWNKVVYESLFPLFERMGLHVLPVHHYSPVPDTRRLRADLTSWYRESPFTGVDFRLDAQLRLVDELSAFREEYSALPSEEEIAARGYGEGYGDVEARVLFGMLRLLQPKAVIEVGGGVSTYFIASALAANASTQGAMSKILTIEPYPWPALRQLPTETQSSLGLELLVRPVQDVEIDVFKQLEAGDVLFIDSSHVVKLGSDVNYLYLEVLPALAPGVIIHAHDIPFPYPSPDPEYWIFKKHHFWTESALLHAFLAFNDTFEILLSTSYLHHKAGPALAAVFPNDAAQPPPTSLWLKRVR